MAKKRVHSWRLCPIGEHWVSTHPLKVSPSGRSPAGAVTVRHGHCAKNPSGKDQLYPVEIKAIAEQHFSKVKAHPCSIDLGYEKSGKAYDELIAGWVQYWNDVLGPSEPLEPNLIKALIASESGFNPKSLSSMS